MTTDTSPIQRRPASGGNALLVIVSTATIVTIAAEAAFIHWASWALLPVIMLAIILIAGAVVATVARLIDDGELAAPSRPAPAPAEPQAHQPATVPATAPRAVLGH
jgi:hypothetical protein